MLGATSFREKEIDIQYLDNPDNWYLSVLISYGKTWLIWISHDVLNKYILTLFGILLPEDPKRKIVYKLKPLSNYIYNHQVALARRKGNFWSSSQAAICPPVYHKRWKFYNISFKAQLQARSCEYQFYSLSFDPIGNWTRVYRLSRTDTLKSRPLRTYDVILIKSQIQMLLVWQYCKWLE